MLQAAKSVLQFTLPLLLQLTQANNGTVSPHQQLPQGVQWFQIVNYCTAAITICGEFFIIICFIFIPILRKHPNSMLFWNAVCDLCFALFLLITPFFPPDWFPKGSPACKFVASTHQFLSMVSISWNMMISLDLLLLLRNPFQASQGKISICGKGIPLWLLYHIAVWGLGFATAPWFWLDNFVELDSARMYVCIILKIYLYALTIRAITVALPRERFNFFT